VRVEQKKGENLHSPEKNPLLSGSTKRKDRQERTGVNKGQRSPWYASCGFVLYFGLNDTTTKELGREGGEKNYKLRMGKSGVDGSCLARQDIGLFAH